MRTSPGIFWPIALVCAACSEAEAPPAYEHRAVVAPAILRLEQEIAAAHSESEAATEVDPEHARGLVTMLASAGPRERELPLEEVELLGEAAAEPLLELIGEGVLEPNDRAAAIELLGRAGGERAADALLALVRTDPEPWVRSHAAWQLGGVGIDRVVPNLVLHLRYEKSSDVVVWVCRALARLGSFAGVPVLRELEGDPVRTPEARALAAAELSNMATELGFGDGAALALTREIADPDGRLPEPEPSPGLQLATWRLIAQLSGEHFQLRGVDDARFVLSRLESWAAEPLAAALREDDMWLRVHAAQCLERMGPRAMSAGPALVEALADPTLAPQAARALGELYWPAAGPQLARLLEARHPHELRVAGARAVGRLRVAEALSTLEFVLGDTREPQDLRQAAAEALVEMGAGDGAARTLLSFLEDPLADRAAAEQALGRWLAARQDDAGRAVFERWDELGRSNTYPAPTLEEVETRMVERARLVRQQLGELVG